MKLQFKQQQYQQDATDALVRVFDGQMKGFMRRETMGRYIENKGQIDETVIVEEMFTNQKITLDRGKILKNIQELQKDQGLPVSQKLEGEGLNLTVEMETGTGKTYVYTKSMFELNRRYGWSKFIIMVPSIAIREGVMKSLQITAEHFQEEYKKKVRFFAYDTKNKSNLVNIKKFAQSGEIEVIVMNYQAFGRRGKDNLKIFQRLDELQSEKPIDIIKGVRPILIIDEPQRFGNTAQSMLAEFQPLFITRFSATHKEEFNKIYRLDAVDAFNHKLVKKIRVKGIESKGSVGTNGYLYLDQIHVSPKEYPKALVQMEMETKQGTGLARKLKKIKEGDSLYELSGELEQYRELGRVKEINAQTNSVTFTNGVELAVGQVMGDVDESHVRRIQIREAIASHLEKEQELYMLGIKVLTLFFIDEVAKYRKYDETTGEHLIGQAEYEEIFEEEYTRAIAQQGLFGSAYEEYLKRFDVREVHNGYFSIDKKGKAVNSRERRGQDGSDDVSAYDLIMKDKEQLLSFAEPTRFIFSHSALREGWDNPNIFQICTLRHSTSAISKRQEIGRGLRIAVNSSGIRMDYQMLEEKFFEVNTLTIIANESYDTFARDLQNEIVDSLSNRPSALEVSVLKGRVLHGENGEKFTFDDASAMDLIFHFKFQGYIDDKYKITDKLVSAIEKKELQLPEMYAPYAEHLSQILMDVHATDTFRSSENALADDVHERDVKPNDNFHKQEFQELWNRIKVKTVYDVSFDTEELIDASVKAIDKELSVRGVTINVVEGVQINEMKEEYIKDRTTIQKEKSQTYKMDSILGQIRYDLLSEIAKDAQVTRRTVAQILQRIDRVKFSLFQVNPEHFIREVSRIIQEQKATTLINHITYREVDQEYDNEIFTLPMLRGKLGENVLASNKHIYPYVKTDSKTEYTFAQELDTGDDSVLVYAKLPRGFKIPTPVGNYNPDWAIVFDEEKVKHIYFIAETKGSMSTMQLKKAEELKIDYARKHFEALGSKEVRYDVVKTYEDLMQKVMR